jgi:hypothetical protein
MHVVPGMYRYRIGLLPNAKETVERGREDLLVPCAYLNSATRDRIGRDSSVGIATGYELDGPGIKSRWG